MPDLNPNQFGESEPERPGFYRDRWNNQYSGSDQSHYEYRHGGHSRHRTELDMEVLHHRGSASYEYTQPTGDPRAHAQDLEDDITTRAAYGHGIMPPARLDAVGAYVEGTPKLFGSYEVPGRSVVNSMFGTKRGRAHAGTMLGIAARNTLVERGRQLQPPDDLSRHSAALVSKLKGKGAVAEDASDEVTNNYTFYGEPEYSSPTAERIPESEVKAGRSMLRATLRGDRPRKQRETYVQERLF